MSSMDDLMHLRGCWPGEEPAIGAVRAAQIRFPLSQEPRPRPLPTHRQNPKLQVHRRLQGGGNWHWVFCPAVVGKEPFRCHETGKHGADPSCVGP